MQTKEELIQALVEALDESTMVQVMRDIDKSYPDNTAPQGLVALMAKIQEERKIRRPR